MNLRFASYGLAAAALLASQSCVCAADGGAQTAVSPGKTRAALRSISTDPQISACVTSIARAALKRFPDLDLGPKDLAVALIIDDGARPVMGGWNLDTPFYPASVVKLAYAVALEKDFASERLPRDRDTLRDLRDMLAISSNAATNRILDRLSGTESGPELPPEDLKAFAEKRNAVNHYLEDLGFSGINACQKTWDVEPYGRDTQFLGAKYENRNSMTAADTARLLWLIRKGKVVSAEACDEILTSLRRRPGNAKDIQARRIGAGIPPLSRLWSKAGWTSETNHDAAFVELPLGKPFVLVVFTNTGWKNGAIISYIAERISADIRLDRLPPEFTKAQPGRFSSQGGGAGGK